MNYIAAQVVFSQIMRESLQSQSDLLHVMSTNRRILRKLLNGLLRDIPKQLATRKKKLEDNVEVALYQAKGREAKRLQRKEKKVMIIKTKSATCADDDLLGQKILATQGYCQFSLLTDNVLDEA